MTAKKTSATDHLAHLLALARRGEIVCLSVGRGVGDPYQVGFGRYVEDIEVLAEGDEAEIRDWLAATAEAENAGGAESIGKALAEYDAAAAEGEMVTLECPCCGDVAAEADAKGMFVEGQPTICGCSGISVTVDDGGDEPAEMYISWDDSEPCKKCDAADVTAKPQ